MRSFSFRRMTSINLSYAITGSITKCHNDSLDLKEVYGFFTIFLSFLMFSLKFMNMQIRQHKMKRLCLSFLMRPGSMVYNK